jgi:AAA family ATP:ADP antiporter
MKDRLFRLISIDAAEESRVTMLLCQALFLGIFYGTFDVTAHSIFLSVFDEKMMARAYVVSGLSGIILTFLYLRFHTRTGFRNLSILNLVFITAVTLVLWLLLLLNPAGWVLFAAFIMLGPLNILALLVFRENINHLFEAKHVKNLRGIVEGGLMTGIIITCYTIPVILSFNIKAQNILIISALSVLIVMVLQIMLGRSFLSGAVEYRQSPQDDGSRKTLLGLVRANPLISIISAFTVLSVMTVFFIQYSFMAVTRIQYPGPEDLARFLGLFTGSMMVLTLVIKFLVFPYFIRNFRLLTCLLISPVLIAIFTVITVVAGFIMGYTPAAGGFMLFFFFLALSRFFSRSLKESFESTSVEVILRSPDEKIRDIAEPRLSGIVNETAVLSSGIVLALLGIMSFVNLIHFSLVLVVIAVLWILTAFKLYFVYRDSVREINKASEQSGLNESHLPELFRLKSRFSARMAFRHDYFSLITGDLINFERNNNRWYLVEILDHADIRKDINLLPVLKKIRSGTGIEKDIRQRSAEIIAQMEQIPSGVRTMQDRVFNAIHFLADTSRPHTSEVLKLLRDKNNDLREIALCIIRKFRMAELIPEVCECLGNSALEFQAVSVLKGFGQEADESLRRFYLLSTGNIAVCKRVLQLLGETCSRENEEFLLSLLWSGPRQTRETALKSLAGCNYRIGEEDKERILRLISDVIGNITWNLSARISIQGNNVAHLHEALNKDIERWNSFLFNLLSITYDRGIINSIRENVESGSVESVNHALEIIDIVIDESLRPKLKPLLDILHDRKKLNILHRFFPGEITEYKKVIEDIINRDYNLLGVWIRACVIRNMPEIENEDMAQSFVALLFSPETVLREETAKLLSRSGREFFKAASDRIPGASKARLEKIISGDIPERDLFFEKVIFLESLFHRLPEDNLFFLAGELIFTDNLSTGLLPLQSGFVLWKCNNKKPEYQALISYENVMINLAEQDSGTSCYMLPLNAVEEYLDKFPEHSLEILNYIDEIE